MQNPALLEKMREMEQKQKLLEALQVRNKRDSDFVLQVVVHIVWTTAAQNLPGKIPTLIGTRQYSAR